MKRIKSLLVKKGNQEKNEMVFDPDVTEDEKSIIRLCKPYTMTSVDRMISLIRSIEYIISNKLPGAFVECGVWKGGSAMLMGAALTKLAAKRKIYLFDTFSGMTEPTSDDKDLTGNSAKKLMNIQNPETSLVWAKSGRREVEQNLELSGYSDFNIIQGDVAKTLILNNNLPDQIALLRLDTDWYESTKVELEILYPRLVKGGILIIDDYGHWQGAKKAVDEYFSKFKTLPYMHRIDYTGRLIIKG